VDRGCRHHGSDELVLLSSQRSLNHTEGRDERFSRTVRISFYQVCESKHPLEYWLNSASKSSLHAYGSKVVVKIYPQMDQSVLLYGGIAGLAFLALSVSTKSLSCGVHDEDPFILVLRALGHLSRRAPWRGRQNRVRDYIPV
jgi:hypothetical protein